MAERYYQINSWDGGLSDSALRGMKGSISEGRGLDIRSEPGVLKVSQALSKESSGTVTGLCELSILASDGNAYFAERLTGKIYKRKAAGTWVNVATLADGNATAIAEWNNKLWFITKGTITNITVANANSNDNWINPPSPGIYGTLTTGTFHPTVVQGLYLLIGNGTNIATIDDTETLTKNGTPNVTLADLTRDNQIITISKFGLDILAGTRNATDFPRAGVWRWDTVSPTYIASDEILETGVNAFIPVDNFMFVQAGNQGNLYFFDGAKLYPKRKIRGDYKNKLMEVLPESITSFGGVSCFGVSNLSGNPNLQGVYTYGRRDADYPFSLMLEYMPSVNKTSGMKIGALLSKGTALLVAWQDVTNGTQGVDVIDYGTKYGSAYFKTMAISGNRRAKKTFLEQAISYKAKPTGTNITLHQDSNFADTFAGTITLKDDSSYNKMFAQNKFEAGAAQFKIDLSSSGNDAPEIEEVFTSWNEQETL